MNNTLPSKYFSIKLAAQFQWIHLRNLILSRTSFGANGIKISERIASANSMGSMFTSRLSYFLFGHPAMSVYRIAISPYSIVPGGFFSTTLKEQLPCRMPPHVLFSADATSRLSSSTWSSNALRPLSVKQAQVRCRPFILLLRCFT